MAQDGNIITVDTTQFQRMFHELSAHLSEENMQKLYVRTLNETGKKARTIIPRALRMEYAAKPAVGFYKKDIKSARISRKPGNVTCVIPIGGKRGYNADTYEIRGLPNHGHTQKGVRQLLTIRNVRGRNNQLPATMRNYGGHPPFLNRKYILVRLTSKRYPIARVPGLATAEMPLHRSREQVETDLEFYMIQRLVHNFNYIMQQQLDKGI